MPDLIGDELIVGILHDIADCSGLIVGADLLQRNTVEKNRAASPAVGCQNRFQMAQQGRFPRTGFTEQNHIFSFFNRQADVSQRGSGVGSGVGEGQIADLEMCH